MRYVQYDCTDMDPQEKKTKVQQPLYEAFRQIYRGPKYETPYFCYKKLEKTSPEVSMIACELCYNESNQVVGGTAVKMITYIFKDQPITVQEGTTGYLENYRGSNHGQIFMNYIQIQFHEKFPTHRICYFDLLTTLSSYKSFSYLNFTYPKPEVETPPEVQEIIDFLISKNKNYKLISNQNIQKGVYVLQGANVRETPLNLYTRLTRGKGSNLLEFFYQQTGAINGVGIMSFIDSSTIGLDYNQFVKAYQQRIQSQNKPHVLPKLPHSDLDYLIQLREDISVYRDYTKYNMIPSFVDISLQESDIEFLRSELSKIGIDNSQIKYMTKINGLSYKDYSKILSSKQMTITFNHRNHPIFAAIIPRGQFNPFIGPIGAKFVELIMHDDINVKDKDIIDLGCGCGNIGMAAILMGASKVLFSDIIVEYLEHIRNYELIVKEDHEFINQNLLNETIKNQENINKYDVVIMNTPTFSFTQELNNSSIYYQQDLLYGYSKFYENLLNQSYSVLKNNGDIYLWSLFIDLSPQTVIKFFKNFRNNFNILNFQIICIELQSKIGIFDAEEISPDNFYIIYTIKKIITKPYSDFQFEITISLGLLYFAQFLSARGFNKLSKQFYEAYYLRKSELKNPKL